MPSGGGEVRISTAWVQTNQATSEHRAAGDYVRVRVQDNGSGMPDYVARRVFDPFFTTKGEKGIGLGVPQVGAFMRHIGGHATISSQQGRGTTVDLFFPAIEPDCPLPHADWTSAPDDVSDILADNAVGPLSRKIDSMRVSHPAVPSWKTRQTVGAADRQRIARRKRGLQFLVQFHIELLPRHLLVDFRLIDVLMHVSLQATR
jgi:Histidine kinase-, DNA gyrase B-, and HSP90-like ATPase